jgi:phosphoribosyl 1,2-cyclic phosphodiesterase
MAEPGYKLRFWGARGTVPTPSADKLRFGGNTSCLGVELDDHEHIILDCGTGVRFLGNSLAGRADGRQRRFHVFFSHYHFDHIEGLPLFQPLYDASSSIRFYGFETCGRSMRNVLESLIAPPYFPVTLADVPAKLEYVPVDGPPTLVRDVAVSALPLNHPDGCRAFRLDRGSRSIVYATDHEHGDADADRALVEFSRDADHLIYDATYTPSEYEEMRKGWGHSTWYAAVQSALAARVKNLVLFHHHPEHTDDELERLLSVTRQEFPATELAREGLELPL